MRTRWNRILWLLMTALMTTFLLYCGFFSPAWLPKSGIVSTIFALGGLSIILSAAYFLGSFWLLVMGLVLSLLSNLVAGQQAMSAARNPLLLNSISMVMEALGVGCLAAAAVIGIRNKIRS